MGRCTPQAWADGMRAPGGPVEEDGCEGDGCGHEEKPPGKPCRRLPGLRHLSHQTVQWGGAHGVELIWSRNPFAASALSRPIGCWLYLASS